MPTKSTHGLEDLVAERESLMRHEQMLVAEHHEAMRNLRARLLALDKQIVSLGGTARDDTSSPEDDAALLASLSLVPSVAPFPNDDEEGGDAKEPKKKSRGRKRKAADDDDGGNDGGAKKRGRKKKGDSREGRPEEARGAQEQRRGRGKRRARGPHALDVPVRGGAPGDADALRQVQTLARREAWKALDVQAQGGGGGRREERRFVGQGQRQEGRGERCRVRRGQAQGRGEHRSLEQGRGKHEGDDRSCGEQARSQGRERRCLVEQAQGAGRAERERLLHFQHRQCPLGVREHPHARNEVRLPPRRDQGRDVPDGQRRGERALPRRDGRGGRTLGEAQARAPLDVEEEHFGGQQQHFVEGFRRGSPKEAGPSQEGEGRGRRGSLPDGRAERSERRRRAAGSDAASPSRH